MDNIQIHTCFDCARASQFARLKRKKRTGWNFLVSGEWSESPYHEGNVTFLYSCTADKRYWALFERSFPSRIVAVAEAAAGTSAEAVIGEMLRRVHDDGGPYIEGIFDSAEDEIDFGVVWDIYTKS